MPLQAMDMISIAQSSGDISADIYRQKSAKPVETPQLAGLEKHHQKLLAQAQAEQNPFTNGASSSARTLPDGQSLLDILLRPALDRHCTACMMSMSSANSKTNAEPDPIRPDSIRELPVNDEPSVTACVPQLHILRIVS